MPRKIVHLLLLALFFVWLSPGDGVAKESKPMSKEKKVGQCMTCHKKESPGLYKQWASSTHAKNGITCYSCHEAQKSDADAFEHEGLTIATLVTPKDCGNCHEKQEKQVAMSHHAKAGKILESLDNYLAGVEAGQPAVVLGCKQCHGSKIVIDPKSPNKLAKGSWPNSGIGRINPDGSNGSCNACHSRHSFSKELARQPDNCGKCHLGPDHPQKEIYEESKHGIAYEAFKDKLNMDKDKWVVGEDYYQAPTCATCHMSATKKQKMTHDVGERLSWNLRAPVSKPQKDSKAKREKMTDVCLACHGKRFVAGFYKQFDGVINLFDMKFGAPAKKIMGILKKNKSLKRSAKFSNDVEWIYWELWHHEGRRARHGASMNGPDYTWWHGMYEVSKHFYMKFIPAVRKLGDKEANEYIDALLKTDMHKWYDAPAEETLGLLKSGDIAKPYLGLNTPPWERALSK